MSAEKHTLPADAIVSYFLGENASTAQAIIEEWKNKSNLNGAFADELIFTRYILREYNAILMKHGRPKLSKRQMQGAQPLPEEHRRALRAVVEVLYETVVNGLVEEINRKMREHGL